MSITVRFFASLAETVGRREASCAFRDGLTVASVWAEVLPDQALPEPVLCAVNHDYCDVEQVLADGDEVAFFPPVTGG